MRKYISTFIGVTGLLSAFFVFGIYIASPAEAVDDPEPTESAYILNRIQERQQEWHILNSEYEILVASGSLVKGKMDHLSMLNNDAREYLESINPKNAYKGNLQ